MLQSTSLLCKQLLENLHLSEYCLKSKYDLDSSNFVIENSNDENPGVSINCPPIQSIILTILVVCLPRPNALDISPVSSCKPVILLIVVDLPAPVCPVNTVSLSLNIFFKLSIPSPIHFKLHTLHNLVFYILLNESHLLNLFL